MVAPSSWQCRNERQRIGAVEAILPSPSSEIGARPARLAIPSDSSEPSFCEVDQGGGRRFATAQTRLCPIAPSTSYSVHEPTAIPSALWLLETSKPSHSLTGS